MATADAYYSSRSDESSLLDPNRSDIVGASLSTLLPLAAALIVNGLAQGMGWFVQPVSAEALPFAPPSWVSSAIWLAIYPMWGLARWMTWQAGERGRRASYWVLALIGWGLLYPLLASGFDMFWVTFGSVFSLLLAIIVAARVGEVSRPALFLMLPSVAWFGLATFIGFAAIAQGWSPGFAATQDGAAQA